MEASSKVSERFPGVFISKKKKNSTCSMVSVDSLIASEELSVPSALNSSNPATPEKPAQCIKPASESGSGAGQLDELNGLANLGIGASDSLNSLAQTRPTVEDGLSKPVSDDGIAKVQSHHLFPLPVDSNLEPPACASAASACYAVNSPYRCLCPQCSQRGSSSNAAGIPTATATAEEQVYGYIPRQVHFGQMETVYQPLVLASRSAAVHNEVHFHPPASSSPMPMPTMSAPAVCALPSHQYSPTTNSYNPTPMSSATTTSSTTAMVDPATASFLAAAYPAYASQMFAMAGAAAPASAMGMMPQAIPGSEAYGMQPPAAGGIDMVNGVAAAANGLKAMTTGVSPASAFSFADFFLKYMRNIKRDADSRNTGNQSQPQPWNRSGSLCSSVGSSLLPAAPANTNLGASPTSLSLTRSQSLGESTSSCSSSSSQDSLSGSKMANASTTSDSSITDSQPGNGSTADAEASNSDAQNKSEAEKAKSAVDPRKYKTRLCRNWIEKGTCQYEHTCCFAHGKEELRDLTKNHQLLASIGYFSNVVLLSMTNGVKPALPPHHLYDQARLFPTPQKPEEFDHLGDTLPPGTNFPFQAPMPVALKPLRNTNTNQTENRTQERQGNFSSSGNSYSGGSSSNNNHRYSSYQHHANEGGGGNTHSAFASASRASYRPGSGSGYSSSSGRQY